MKYWNTEENSISRHEGEMISLKTEGFDGKETQMVVGVFVREGTVYIGEVCDCAYYAALSPEQAKAALQEAIDYIDSKT